MTRAYVVPPLCSRWPTIRLSIEFDLSSLRWMLSGAAPLGNDLIRRCEERLGCLVFQGYGMTEAVGPRTSRRPAATR